MEEKLRTAILAFIASLFVSLPAHTQEAELFASATEAFERADFEQALILFERARDAGIEGPAVHYNIGVCQYELGLYDQAEATFRAVATNYPAMQALAEYNVGLSLLRQGLDAEAREHFLFARENSRDRKVVQLANTALRQLAGADVAVGGLGASWAGIVDLTIGYDENVALIDESTIATGQTVDSRFAEILAVVSGPISSAPGFRFDGSLYSVAYDDAGEFDQTALRVGGSYQWRAGVW